jgi:cell division inhibitor SepF
MQPGKVVNIHTPQQFKVVVMNPENFEDAKEVTEHLKNKKPVVINLLKLEKEFAQRILDFLSGGVCALEGSIQKVSQGIFVVAPNNVDVMGEFKDELRNNKSALFPWVKG